MNRFKVTAVGLALALAIGAVAWTNRGPIAAWLAPAKKAATTRSEAALKADEVFWRTFHAGAYDEIAPALEALTAAYLKTPGDAVTAAHIAWLHNWRMAE